MNTKKLLLIGILILGLTTALIAQAKFSSENAYQYIEELSKPEFGGRKTGLTPARKAAEWIASKFEEWGLEPGGDNGTFIQEYPMLVTQQKRMAKLELKNGAFGLVKYRENNDFTLSFNSGSSKGTAEVIFIGYGLLAPDKGWDDYADVDVMGKIILLTRGRPDDGKDYSKEMERKTMMEIAVRKGALAMLMMSSREFPIRGYTVSKDAYQSTLPVFNISRKMARDIFQGTLKNMDNTIRDLSKSPQSFATGKIMKLETAYERIEPGIGENTIAILPGTDPVLKNEYIVLGAHMDHNGMSPDGMIFAGSDDNASGTAVVMELARIFKSSGKKLKRSVVFAGFGGEEQGLIGSKYFADNPTMPFHGICLNFNFDMVGAGDGTGSYSGMNYFPDVFKELLASYPESLREKVSTRRGSGMGGSDHAHFIKQGIPSFGFRSSGDHPFYHRFEDNMNCINKEALQFVGNRASEMLEKMGNYSTSLLFNNIHQGRTFVLFGDQVAFDMPEAMHEEIVTDLEGFIRDRFTLGLHGMVIPLNDTSSTDDEILDLYKTAGKLPIWIDSKKDMLVSFNNSQSFNDAAGNEKLTALMGIQGTTCLENQPGHFRNLTKIGIDVLTISDASDPLFEMGSVSDFGMQILKTCKDRKVVLDWTIDDIELFISTLNSYEGKVILRLNARDLDPIEPALSELLKKENILLVAQCNPSCRASDLSNMIDAVGDRNIHFSGVSFILDHDADPFYRLIKEFYDIRLKEKDKDKREVYSTMVRILGGNMKAMLDR